jgi:hypothetical protein
VGAKGGFIPIRRLEDTQGKAFEAEALLKLAESWKGLRFEQ